MEKWMNRPAWVEIDLRVLDKNTKLVLERLAPGAKALAVVKADCYGHCMKECYPVFKANGITDYGVAALSEAIELRSYGDPADRIVLFALTPPMFVETVCEYNVVTLVQNLEYAKALSDEAVKRGMEIEVMGVVDTGMGRIGYQWDDPACVEEIYEASTYPGLKMIGIFSHLSCEDFEDKYWSDQQHARFEHVLKGLRAKGLEMPCNSLANSPATSHRKELHYGLCRPGGSLYGRYQDSCVELPGVEAVMTVKAVITQLKDVPDNFSISYGRSGRTDRPSKIATLGLGYADGLPRYWGAGRGRVIVNGCFAPTIGNMCMDQFMIDVTDVPDVKVGDEVVLIGRQGDKEIKLGDFADVCDTLSNEISCGMPARLPYKFIR
ncbi:MAG: alanine racemase [Clostridia bacterium]|nr:alanine racemase [Clostridia bacterium]